MQENCHDIHPLMIVPNFNKRKRKKEEKTHDAQKRFDEIEIKLSSK